MAFLLFLSFVAIQFYRPSKNQSPGDHTSRFLLETNPPGSLKVILKQACYDCHSNNTDYPWYNNVAPISFWLAYHVKDGKKHLNFSDWQDYTAEKKAYMLEDVIEMVLEGKMPLKKYTWLHEEARLTEKQRNEVGEWAKRTSALYLLNRRPK